MNPSIKTPPSKMVEYASFDIEKNENQHNSISTFCGRALKSCKKVSNILVHAAFVLGGVGVVLGAISKPLISVALAPTHLNTSSICYLETETRIKAYDEQMAKASLIAGLLGALLPTLTLGAHYLGEKLASDT